MNATKLRIRIFGDPALRRKAKPVNQITEAHRNVLQEMAELMHEASGIGLAGPQVGINESLIVVDIGSGLYKLINPRVVKKEGHQVMEEGCLSVPGVCIKIKRAQKVWVVAQDEFAQTVKIEASDLLACVLQHEIEHLKGKLIVDYASLLGKLRIRKKLSRFKKQREDESRTFFKNGCGIKEKVRDEEVPESKTKSCKLQL